MAVDILHELDELLAEQRALYRDLHLQPELSMQEHNTAQRIEDELDTLDVEVQRIGGTGVVAVLRNGDGPTIMARADTDALPLSEQTGLDYASKIDGVMHACGHDMHVATLLGAVKVLAAKPQAWAGTYIAVFQPGEELSVPKQCWMMVWSRRSRDPRLPWHNMLCPLKLAPSAPAPERFYLPGIPSK